MKKLLFGIAAAGLAAAVLTPLAGAAAPLQCATGNLRVSFDLVPNSQGAGNVVYTLKVTNTGASACNLGKPRITLLGTTGAALPSHSIAPNQGVLVPAGATATATARFSPDVPGHGDRQTGQCQPTAHEVKVRFAGVSGAVTGPVKPPTPVCESGTMTLQALKG